MQDFVAAGYPFENEKSANKPHDVRVFREGNAIFTETDLRELINCIYSDYQYRGSQVAPLVAMIKYMASGDNEFINPELIKESAKLGSYLNSFSDFLERNFQNAQLTDTQDSVYLFRTPGTGFETEAFLIEFQMLSMDVENAFKHYRAAVLDRLQI